MRRQPFILLSFSSSKKARKAQETQSYQRFQHIVHTVFNTSGTNAPRSLSRVKAGYTLAFAQRIAHTGLHAETGVFWTGVVSLPSDCFTRFGNPAWPGGRTANFAAFGSWSGGALEERRKPSGQRCAHACRCSAGVAAPLGCVALLPLLIQHDLVR